MLSVTRRAAIKDILLEKKSVSVSKLAKYFTVTEETIRRDLKALEDEGFLIRTYGGAFIQDGVQNEISLSVRKTAYVQQKLRIARQCAKLIHNGDSIFLDSSTTVGFLCQFIKNARITVVTNSLFVTNSLSDCDDINLIMVGGAYDSPTMSFVGQATMDTLSGYYVDKAFISCRSLNLAHGMTDSNEKYAAVHRLMLEHGSEVYLLADATKFGKTSFVHVGGFGSVDGLFCDQA